MKLRSGQVYRLGSHLDERQLVVVLLSRSSHVTYKLEPWDALVIEDSLIPSREGQVTCFDMDYFEDWERIA